MAQVLAHNPLIAKNYLVMQLRRELRLRSGGGSDFEERLVRYKGIYERRRGGGGGELPREGEEGGYGSLFATYWRFAPATNEVLLIAGRESGEMTSVDLPTPEELAAGTYGMTREYWDLIRLRGELIEYVYRNDMEVFGGGELIRDGYWVWR